MSTVSVAGSVVGSGTVESGAGVPLASGKSEIFEIVLRFLPEWVQIAVLALIVLAVVASWVLKLKRKIDHRRAVRTGVVAPAPVAPGGQGSGADHLGAWAPQNQPHARQPQTPPQAPASGGPRGADFLGAYAPPRAPDASH
ncbi:MULTISPECIES: hypothetical protein [unclassified Streptomyces]|uniref:hypothetical protein n=1 Tax=unclassified Streptomyces TaxID=2593676 RepID=UPI00380E9618